MNRRTLLRGVAVGSIVPATNVATGSVGTQDETAADDPNADDAGPDDTGDVPVSVRIVEIPDTVVGGALLDWTVELENPTDEPIRPTVEYTVDGESLGTVTLTVGPGATERPTAPSYQTEPVATADEVTVRVAANGDSDERTVRVLPADELDEAFQFPESELTVQPETTVHFEVGAVDPEASQTTTWWVDGERVGDTFADPWQGTYFFEQGAHFWQETFETQGTYEVVAGVDVDGEQYRASWTVTVAPEGLADPTIEAARPEAGILEVDREDPTATTLELDVADPDGNLDRVVWWLTQADTILGVSEVSGASDTATLTVDGGLCHTCVVVPWVITGDGTFTSAFLWEVDDVDVDFGEPDEPGEPADPDDPGVDPDDPPTEPEKPRDDPPTEPEKPRDKPDDPRADPDKSGSKPDKPGDKPAKYGSDGGEPRDDHTGTAQTDSASDDGCST
ncbi:hypothetical protein [Natronorubrum sp. FCH18a]|uniref:hypothetical protein n=1 Tax=Natronorubrum sp. FCH18a TaxID=3447018 RepID=UPI003F50EB9B